MSKTPSAIFTSQLDASTILLPFACLICIAMYKELYWELP